MRNSVTAIALLGCVGCMGLIGDPTAEPMGPGAPRPGSADGPSPSTGATCDGICVGETHASRITRHVYANAIAAVFGVTVDVDQLPSDFSSGGFASNESVAIDPAEVGRYQRTAEAVADAASTSGFIESECANADCVDEFITTIGRRLFRQPLADDDRRAYAALAAGAEGSIGDGLRLVVEAMLQSARFLYYWERGAPSTEEGVVELTSFEVAARLARFLWLSVPDDQLLDAAASGELDTTEGLAASARRLLDDPRADEAIGIFVTGWLSTDVGALDLADDPDGASLAGSMSEEVRRMTLAWLREDGRLPTLFTTRQTFVDPLLADHYGIVHPTGTGFERVELPEERVGVLTTAGFLAAHGTESFTSAVYRGLAIRSRLFCEAMPAPPAELADTISQALTDQETSGIADRTDRERLDDLTGEAPCSSCHSMINPAGYAFERFDALGRFRATQRGLPIDTGGELRGTDVDGAFEDANGLAARVSGSQDLARCTTRHWFRFALGRLDGSDDVNAIDDALGELIENDLDIPTLIVGLVRSDAFRYRRIPSS